MKHKSILKYILMISAATSMMSCNGDLDVMQDNKLSASNMVDDINRCHPVHLRDLRAHAFQFR